MPTLVYSDADDLVSRLQRVLSAVALDCRCRVNLERALDRFGALERRRQMRKAIAEAREQRDQIVARLAFLAEIDEITEQEVDGTVFDEVALLFDEIGMASTEAAKAVRATASLRRRKC